MEIEKTYTQKINLGSFQECYYENENIKPFILKYVKENGLIFLKINLLHDFLYIICIKKNDAIQIIYYYEIDQYLNYPIDFHGILIDNLKYKIEANEYVQFEDEYFNGILTIIGNDEIIGDDNLKVIYKEI